MLKRLVGRGGLALLALATFSTAWTVRSHSARAYRGAAPPATTTDSAQLAAAGATPGRQLVAYVFVSSKCGYCQAADTKQAIRGMRTLLIDQYRARFQRIAVVGIALDDHANPGIEYLSGVGTNSFDEIDAGGGWQNEEAVHKIWRDHSSEPEVPQVLVVSRALSSTLSPFDLRFADDSVLRSIRGRAELLKWVRQRAPLEYATGALDLVKSFGAPNPEPRTK